MQEEIPIIRTSQYAREATRWLHALKRQESVCITFIPKTDRFIRIGQFLKDVELFRSVLGSRRKYIFQRLYFDPHDVEDMDDLDHQLAEHLSFAGVLGETTTVSSWMQELDKKNTQLVYVIADAEKLLTRDTKHVFGLLSRVVEQYAPRVQCMLLFEKDITHPDVMSYLPASTHVYENIFHYPLYEKEETVEFIKMLCRQWELTLKDSEVVDIYRSCGGNFWLVKEALREIASRGMWSSSDSGMLFRVRMIYDQLVPCEQTALTKLVGGESSFRDTEVHSIEYLKHMRMIRQKKHVPEVFAEYIRRLLGSRNVLEVKNNRLVLAQMPLDSFLSRKEYRVMELLMQRRGEVVSRDDIAGKIWPLDTQKKYSDWAIDQIIARLRKKLTQLSLNSKRLKTFRGRGYMFEHI